MGSGKTTVGRLLARRTGRDFVDLDHEISRLEGRTIPRSSPKGARTASATSNTRP
jgi:shikimate kinase